jgi:uncharacterized protein (TIGR00299 family) protein
MLLATLVDLGADFDRITALIQTITPEPLALARTPASDSGLHGTRIAVTVQASTEWIAPAKPPQHAHGHSGHHGHGDAHPGHHGHGDAHPESPAAAHAHRPHAPHRGLSEILAILAHPAIPERTRHLAAATFRRLAEAEAHIHGTTPDAIHFHEVGAADAIADITGCCYALELLEVTAVRIGPLPAGCGTLRCAHGEMPNPAPATQILLRGFVVVQTDEPFELVTPTGAALLATWAAELPAAPTQGRILKSGMGFGTRHLNHRPNVLRATLLAPVAPERAQQPAEELTVLETNLDDCNPQWIGDLTGRLLELGALDAWATPIFMKKGRPAITFSVLCTPEAAPQIQQAIFLATPTFGIRRHTVGRTSLVRRHETVETPYGAVRVKIGELDGQVITRTPEFEDCAERARQNKVTPRQVSEAVLKSAVALTATAMTLLAAAPVQGAALDTNTLRDVSFQAQCDGLEQKYVLLYPKVFSPTAPHDILIALHGHGSDRWQFITQPRDECRVARDFAAEHDMLFVSPDYRAATSWMGPKAEADVVQIIAELKRTYRVARVFLCGGSMGGTACLTFAVLHPELIDGVASMNGTANFIEYENFQDAIQASFGGSKADIPDEYKKRSAEFWPEKLTMPVGLAVSGKDTSVPPQSVLRLAETLKKRRQKVLLIYREDLGHVTQYDDGKAILEFMLKHARKKSGN